MKTTLFPSIVLWMLVLFVSANFASAATCHVTKTADTNDGLCDAGDCSLREAVAEPSCATIDFSLDLAGQTIGLTLGEIVIGRSLTIEGYGADAFTISGNDLSRIFTVATSGPVRIAGVTLTKGNGSGGQFTDGGAILTINNTNLTLDGLYFTGNRASGTGGAIAGGGLILNSTFAGNTAKMDFNDGVVVTGGRIRNSVICNNTGPGLYTRGGLPHATNTIIAGNWPSAGAIIEEVGILITGNSIIDNLYLRPGSFSGDVESDGNNIINQAPGGMLVGIFKPSDRFNIDPQLGTLGYYGGHVPTLPLLAGSPGIDTGNNVLASDAGLLTDIRGYQRIFDGDGSGTATVDIGSFEYNSVPAPAPVRVAGRILGGVSGNPQRSVRVTLTDFTGHSYSTLSSSFGWFVFDGLPAGFVYRISVSARRGTQQKTVFGDHDLTDADIFIPGL